MSTRTPAPMASTASNVGNVGPASNALHSSSLTTRPHSWRSLGAASHRDTCICSATDPSIMQDVLMGGAVVSAVGAALVSGIKGEPEVCESCAGSGGVRCFACEGTGKMSGIKIDELTTAAAKRDSLGRNVNLKECKACKGCGLLFCKKCNGSGYVTK